MSKRARTLVSLLGLSMSLAVLPLAGLAGPEDHDKEGSPRAVPSEYRGASAQERWDFEPNESLSDFLFSDVQPTSQPTTSEESRVDKILRTVKDYFKDQLQEGGNE